jgi:hypothetical protein
MFPANIESRNFEILRERLFFGKIKMCAAEILNRKLFI